MISASRYLDILSTIVAAVVLITSALKQLIDPQGLAAAAAHYHLFPRLSLGLIAWWLPPFQLLLALAIVTKHHRLRLAGWLGASCLFLTFSLATAYALARELDISCGFFALEVKVSWLVLAVNLALAAISIKKAAASLRA